MTASFYNVPARTALLIRSAERITETVKAEFSFNCFNVFNHTNFLDPSFDVTNPSTFGVINTQLIPADRLSGSRWIQFAFRVSF